MGNSDGEYRRSGEAGDDDRPLRQYITDSTMWLSRTLLLRSAYYKSKHYVRKEDVAHCRAYYVL